MGLLDRANKFLMKTEGGRLSWLNNIRANYFKLISARYQKSDANNIVSFQTYVTLLLMKCLTLNTCFKFDKWDHIDVFVFNWKNKFKFKLVR